MSEARSASTSAGLVARIWLAMEEASALKSSLLPTKSVSQFTSTRAPVLPSAETAETTAPSAATRLALAAWDSPFFTENIHSLFHIAVSFNECLFAVHHAGAGLGTQISYHTSCNFHLMTSIIKQGVCRNSRSPPRELPWKSFMYGLCIIPFASFPKLLPALLRLQPALLQGSSSFCFLLALAAFEDSVSRILLVSSLTARIASSLAGMGNRSHRDRSWYQR